jgi:hypothetical protein
MWRKITSVILLTAFCLATAGCYRREIMGSAELPAGRTRGVERAVLLDGTVINFSYAPNIVNDRPAVHEGWARIQDSTLTGYSRDEGKYVLQRIPLSQVRLVVVRQLDIGKTIVASIGTVFAVALVVAIIALATKESCPFIYSYNGEQYWFDGEPYGGATCPALQRTDYCRLDSLRPVEGRYRILLANEVDETQHTDELKLLVVDHPADVKVIPDAGGALHAVKSIQPLASATDVRGLDQTKWMASSDELIWESGTDEAAQSTAVPRDSIVLTFSRPAHAQTALLVTNVGTTVWGSQMLKRAEALWGSDLPHWQRALRQPEVLNALAAWNRREEAYVVEARVWTGTDWSVRGDLAGGGPFLCEDRVVPLDLTGVTGDTLRILLTPPPGFWQFNWFAISYEPDKPLTAQELSADTAISHDGKDIRARLQAEDQRYYSTPEVGQRAALVFTAPPLAEGLTRTVFAKASGYYSIHHAEVVARNDSILARIRNEPGYFARYALEQFQEWRETAATTFRR